MLIYSLNDMSDFNINMTAKLLLTYWTTKDWSYCRFTKYRRSVFLQHSVLVSAAASNKSTTWPPLPPPGRGGEWKETGRNLWVGIRAV